MGFSPVEIAKRLGHGKVTTTIETYCHQSMDAQIKIADRLGKVERGEDFLYTRQLNSSLHFMFKETLCPSCKKACACPRSITGSMGKSRADERPYWTLEEFQRFSDAIMDKQDSWVAFQILIGVLPK